MRTKPILRLRGAYRNKAGRMTHRVSASSLVRQEVRWVVGDKLSSAIMDVARLQWGDEASLDDDPVYLPEARLRALPAVKQLVREVTALLEECIAAAKPPKETGRA